MIIKSTEQNIEQMRRELWFTFFTEYLFKQQFITEEQKNNIIKQI